MLKNCISMILIIIFIFLVIQKETVFGVRPTLYGPNDNIEQLDTSNYKSLFGQDRAAFVEFYSHWCGACQRYKKHWIEIANITKPWNEKIMRVVAINCGDTSNADVCNEFNVNFYPMIKLVKPYAKFENKDHDAIQLKTQGTDELVKTAIEFIGNIENKPKTWPELKFQFNLNKENLFLDNPKAEYSLVIFEENESILGKRLILDFSARQNQLPIHRLIKNSELFTRLKAYNLPSIYVIKNDAKKSHQLFDKTFVDWFVQQNPIISNEFIKTISVLDDKNYNALYDLEKYQYIIKVFINHLKEVLVDGSNVGTVHPNQIVNPLIIENDKEPQEQIYLTSTDNRVFMGDLETGLSMMLRSDIGSNKFITGDKMLALKEILRVLVKFFPGRTPVRSYLTKLYNEIKEKKEITSHQWKSLTDLDKSISYLPSHDNQWRHCKGSEPIYRGYPCSLWTIFHVLTVSQIEQEKAKQTPFSDDYNVKEVIKGIRLFVINFFTCSECSQNFKMETKDWSSHLSQPFDAVKYIWEIHNRVNERLKTEKGNNDPKYPKEIYPNKSQCSKCYNADLSFNENEVVNYLVSFYSKFQIEGAIQLEIKRAEQENRETAELEKGGIHPKILNKKDKDYLINENLKDYQTNVKKPGGYFVTFVMIACILVILVLFRQFCKLISKRERIKAHII